MIHANEAKKIAKDNNHTEETLHNMIERILPKFDESIRFCANRGYNKTKICMGDIEFERKGIEEWAISKPVLMKALLDEIRSYGFTAETTASYSSITVEW